MNHKVIDGVTYFEGDYTKEKRMDTFVTWFAVVLFSVVYAGALVWFAFNGAPLN